MTLKEEKLQNLVAKLDNEHVVDLLALPGLVQFSERLEFNEEIVLPYLKEQLLKYNLSNYETIVLGCTHFSYYKDMFRKLFPSHVNIIDGNIGTAKNLKRILKENNLLNEGCGIITFYNSGLKVEDKAELDKYNRLLKKLDNLY